MKFKSNHRNDKRFPPRAKNEAFAKNESSSDDTGKEDEIQPKEISHERPEMTDENRHFRNRGRFDRNHKPHFKKDRNHSQKTDDFPRHSSSEPEGEVNNEEMAARRKQNQSLLNEIWKKIVD
jgi:hypothetical protein